MWVCEFVVRACMHVRVNPRVHPRIQCLNTTVCVLFYRTMLTACPPPPLPPLRTPIQIKKCIYCAYCSIAQYRLAAPHLRSFLSPSQYRSRSLSTVCTVVSHNADSLPPTLRVEYAERRTKYGFLFIFTLFCEYIHLEYIHTHVVYRVKQAEYVIPTPVAAPQEYLNTYSTRRPPNPAPSSPHPNTDQEVHLLCSG